MTDARLPWNRLQGELELRQRIPSSTYRIQFHGGFTFHDAAAIVPYLAQLGADACYCSPFLQAKPGTQHGYDICDHDDFHAELGSETDYLGFTSALDEVQMGQIIDFVPNHMGVDPVHNRWWRDVLENGPSSPFAHFFDIDWDPVKRELRGKVLLPLLEDQYGIVLERGDLQLEWHEGRLIVRRGELHFPVDPKQYLHVLQYRLDALAKQLGGEDSSLGTYRELVQAFHELPGCSETDRCEERQERKEELLSRLQTLIQACPEISSHIEHNLAVFNGEPGNRESFDLLHEFLEAQPYRLAHWKAAHDEINYRRFFHIHELGGLRMEDADVFTATHRLVLRLVREGRVTGIRLDHLDGLFDPLGYLERLQEAVLIEWVDDQLRRDVTHDPEVDSAVAQWRVDQQQRTPGGIADRPLYLIAEKILSPNESLPKAWPLHGTSGYEFLNDLNRLFVDSENRNPMREIYERFTAQQTSYEEEAYRCKKLITQVAMASELKMLARALNRISERDRRTRDYTLDSLRETIREVVACFPVYRTYLDGFGIRQADREIVHRAVGRAVWRNPAMSPTVFAFLRQVLLLEGDLAADEYDRRLEFVMKFQQYTGPVEAKGVEDTAFYRYHLLLSLNEVGGTPDRFGASPDEFHAANRRRRQEWPAAMLATATHDNKRGEDVRARINVLSEIPSDWQRHVFHWQRLHAVHRTDVAGIPAPAAADEYALYQTLVGAWPAELSVTDAASTQPIPDEFVQRIRQFMLKAIKEASRHTGWTDPIDAYDEAVTSFVDRVLQGPTTAEFLQDFLPFLQQVAQWGMVNSLAQVVLKIISPGVPDFYQGGELWDLSLVDPDNRRPVDYEQRRQMLESLEPLLADRSAEPGAVGELLTHWPDGRIKLFVTACGLRLRRQDPECFLNGDYVPLVVEGPLQPHVVAAARQVEDRSVIAVVPRLVTQLTTAQRPLPIGAATWNDARLTLAPECSANRFRNVLSGEILDSRTTDHGTSLRMADVLATLPVALLIPHPG